MYIIIKINEYITPVIAKAQEKQIIGIERSCYADGSCTLCDLLDVIASIAEWLISFSGSVALLMVVYFGFKLLLPNNTSDGLKKAKTGIVASVTGLAIVLGAWTMMNWGLAFFLTKNENLTFTDTPKLFSSSNEEWYNVCSTYRERNEIDEPGSCKNLYARCAFPINNDSTTTDITSCGESGLCNYGVCIKENQKQICKGYGGEKIKTHGDYNGLGRDHEYPGTLSTWCFYKYGGECYGIKSTKSKTTYITNPPNDFEPVTNEPGICPAGSVCFKDKNHNLQRALSVVAPGVEPTTCASLKNSSACGVWNKECKWTDKGCINK